MLAHLEKTGNAGQQVAVATRKRIDDVITRGLAPKTAAQFSPKGYDIRHRGVNISDFSPSPASPRMQAGKADKPVGVVWVSFFGRGAPCVRGEGD